MKLKTTLLSIFLIVLIVGCDEEKYADWKILNDNIYAQEQVKTTYKSNDNGLLYKIEYAGNMKQANKNSYVVVKYKGTLASGKVFDEGTYSRYLYEAINGWQQAIPMLKVGGKMQIVVPQELGYGKNGSGTIPPYSLLYFDIELLEAYN